MDGLGLLEEKSRYDATVLGRKFNLAMDAEANVTL